MDRIQPFITEAIPEDLAPAVRVGFRLIQEANPNIPEDQIREMLLGRHPAEALWGMGLNHPDLSQFREALMMAGLVPNQASETWWKGLDPKRK